MVKFIILCFFLFLNGCSSFKKDVVDCPKVAAPKKVAEVIVKSENKLPVKEIFEGTQDQKIKDKLIKNTSEAVEKGIFGAPSMLVEDELFFGKESLQDVEELILNKSE